MKAAVISKERMYEVVRGPIITEKATLGSEHNQVTFRVAIDANKNEIKTAIEGLFDVYNYGTASHLKVKGIEICGKTGTSENYTKINGKRTQLTDHSVFVAFAPRNNPKIAVAVFVENGYWGSRWAGRIATLIIEKYINGEITRTDLETYILDGSLEEEYAKPYNGEPFLINQ